MFMWGVQEGWTWQGGEMAHSSVPLVHARAYNGQPSGVPSTRGLCVGWGVEGKPNAEQ